MCLPTSPPTKIMIENNLTLNTFSIIEIKCWIILSSDVTVNI